ncbi:MAG: hypothetical protein U0457_02050 [Candidatus Sericytochromatia bacterium]
MNIYNMTYDAPVQIMNIFEDIQQGNIKFKVENTEEDRFLKVWEQILGKLTAGLVVSSLIISSTIF